MARGNMKALNAYRHCREQVGVKPFKKASSSQKAKVNACFRKKMGK